MGNMNYFQNGKGDGTIVLILAVISLILVLVKRYKGLWFTGFGSVGILSFTFINFQLKMSQIKADMNSKLAGNPFRGFADIAMGSVQLQWGWALLIIGAALVIASAAMKNETQPKKEKANASTSPKVWFSFYEENKWYLIIPIALFLVGGFLLISEVNKVPKKELGDLISQAPKEVSKPILEEQDIKSNESIEVQNPQVQTIAGPFGLGMGMSLKDIGGSPRKIAPGKYELTDVPNPHSAFKKYIVQVAPKNGLCWIKAIGKDISTSAYGIELKSAFNDMKGKLEKSYGEHATTDLLMPGSIWKEPNEFMMGMIKKERFLMAIWNSTKSSRLTNNIKQIGLDAKPNGRDNGYITVEYSFTNEESCEAELSAKEDSTL